MIAPWKNDKLRQAYGRPEIKASLEVILSVFTVALLLMIAIRPTLAIVATLQKKIEDQDTVNRKLSNKLSQLIQSTTDLSTYSDKLPLLNEAVTDDTQRSGLVNRVALLATETGVSLGSLNLEAVPVLGSEINLSDKAKGAKKPPLEPGSNIASFELTFETSGNQEQLLDFITRLTNMDRLVILLNVDFKRETERPAGGGERRIIRLSGKARVYYVL